MPHTHNNTMWMNVSLGYSSRNRLQSIGVKVNIQAQFNFVWQILESHSHCEASFYLKLTHFWFIDYYTDLQTIIHSGISTFELRKYSK